MADFSLCFLYDGDGDGSLFFFSRWVVFLSAVGKHAYVAEARRGTVAGARQAEWADDICAQPLENGLCVLFSLVRVCCCRGYRWGCRAVWGGNGAGSLVF